MLGRMLGRIVAAIVVLAVVAASICIWQRARARNEIELVSTRFVEAASKLDFVGVRECLTDKRRRLLPACYISFAAKKMSELNRDVHVSVRLEVVDVKTNGGEATVRLKRSLTQRGTLLGKQIHTRVNDECIVICVYDGEQWLVDLDRTLKDKRFPAATMSLFKECVGK